MVVIMSKKLVPIDSVDMRGETIREVIFVNMAGGEKMIWIFESGRVLLMPVYHACPVQQGTMEDLRDDLRGLTVSLEADAERFLEESKRKIATIGRLIAEKNLGGGK
jgi:hypothetical protein